MSQDSESYIFALNGAFCGWPGHQRATLDRDIGGSAVLLLPVCAFVNAASFSSKNIFVRTFEGSFEEKSTTFRKHIFRAFRWLQAESKEPNPGK